MFRFFSGEPLIDFRLNSQNSATEILVENLQLVAVATLSLFNH